jgi:hypothetical protein
MTTPIAHRSVAVLKLPRPISAAITYSRNIVTAMTGNKSFTTPLPPLADVSAAIDQLEASEKSALTKVHGAVATRNQDRLALLAKLELLRGYVQNIADADREQASGIIQSANMQVRKVPTRAKRVFTAKQGAVSGSVTLVTASAGRRASYDWESSSDGGKTWQPLPTTLQTKTSMTGLQAGASYSFRYRSVTKTGVGDWSQPVSILLK